MNLLPRLPADKTDGPRQALLKRAAELGGRLFGPVPEGREREFYCLDAHTWIWRESWTGENGRRRTVVTRYDVRPTGVTKRQDDGPEQRLTREEARHLYWSTELFRRRINAEYQRLLQAA
jgi:hypothetical protein